MKTPTTPTEAVQAVADLNKAFEAQLANVSREAVKASFAVAQASVKATRENLERIEPKAMPLPTMPTNFGTPEVQKAMTDAQVVLAQWNDAFVQSLNASRAATLRALNEFEAALAENEKQAYATLEAANTMVREATGKALTATETVVKNTFPAKQ